MLAFTLLLVIIVAPWAFITALGGYLGHLKRGRLGSILGMYLAPAVLLGIPLALNLSRKLEPYEAKLLYYGLFLSITAIGFWPHRQKLKQLNQEHKKKEKQHKNEVRGSTWRRRLSLEIENWKRSSFEHNTTVLGTVAIGSSPLFFDVFSYVFGDKSAPLGLLPAVDPYEYLVILAATHSVLLWLGTCYWNRLRKPKSDILKIALTTATVCFLFSFGLHKWANTIRPFEHVRVSLSSDGSMVYRTERGKGEYYLSVSKEKSHEFGLLDLPNEKSVQLSNFRGHGTYFLNRHNDLVLSHRKKTLFARKVADEQEVEIARDLQGYRVSPNGQTILLLHENKTSLYNLETGKTQPLTHKIESPRWGPDGKKILFKRSNNIGTRNLWLLDIETDSIRQLTGLKTEGSEEANSRFQSWSPDGRWIVYSQYVPKTESDQVLKANYWIIDTQSGSQKPLLKHGPSLFSSSWSHQGLLLLGQDQSYQLWDPDTGSHRQLSIPSYFSDDTDMEEQDAESKMAYISWVPSTNRLVYRGFESEVIRVSENLDQGWQAVHLDTRSEFTILPDGQGFFVPSERAKTDFFCNRSGLKKGRFLDLDGEETATIEWNGHSFDILEVAKND